MQLTSTIYRNDEEIDVFVDCEMLYEPPQRDGGRVDINGFFYFEFESCFDSNRSYYVLTEEEKENLSSKLLSKMEKTK